MNIMRSRFLPRPTLTYRSSPSRTKPAQLFRRYFEPFGSWRCGNRLFRHQHPLTHVGLPTHPTARLNDVHQVALGLITITPLRPISTRATSSPAASTAFAARVTSRSLNRLGRTHWKNGCLLPEIEFQLIGGAVSVQTSQDHIGGFFGTSEPSAKNVVASSASGQHLPAPTPPSYSRPAHGLKGTILGSSDLIFR